MNWLHKLKNSPLAPLYKATILPRARKKFNLIAPLIEQNEKVLDIGCGNAGLSKLFLEEGFKVTALDVVDNSYFPEVEMMTYDGKNLPFETQQFDIAMFITVFHHIPGNQHISMLKQAQRVAKRVIVMEDVFTGKLGEKMTHYTDSLVNLEFSSHPHSNRTELDWETLFKSLNLKITSKLETKTLGYFRQVVYELVPGVSD